MLVPFKCDCNCEAKDSENLEHIKLGLSSKKMITIIGVDSMCSPMKGHSEKLLPSSARYVTVVKC